VFELFVQADKSSAKAQGGLGIGLTIVKNLIEMHGGSVQANSAGLGRGSEFRIRLPLVFAKRHEPTEPSSDRQPRPLAASRRLLVVDDNADSAATLATLLRLEGHEVQVARDGISALDMASSYGPEMVLLDLGMPGMDGYEVARRLRQQPGMENVVLAALTGWGNQEDRRRTAEAGFDHHLVKPIELSVLENLISQLRR
jgi:CheY-like chemotaxis protein